MRPPLLQTTLAVAICLWAAGCSTEPDFDLAITGGSVVDGTGAEPRRADVGVKGDRIVLVGNLSSQGASSTIDATGKIVAPGFIDVLGRSGVSLLGDGFGESHLRQGITTELLGGRSPAFWTAALADQDALRVHGVTFDWSGLNGYFAKLEARGTAINVGTLLPLSEVIGSDAAAIDAALRDGALGVVDDTPQGSPLVTAAADAVGARGAVLMCSVENPAVATDASFGALGARARRTIVEGLSRVPPGDPLSIWIRRLIAANQGQATSYGVVTLDAAAPDGDHAASEALKYGSVLVGTGTAASASTSAEASRAAFGTYPRLLGQMARDGRLFELREAIRRITSSPAAAFGIAQRGIIRENMFADIVVFDATTVGDRSTAENPRQYPSGVEYVIVNGVAVVTPGGLTGSRPGHRVLRGVP